jgi:ectoine hydroxylase-related dioxygenase (phytanoyl-CoA dioxygenase family)
MDGSFTAFDVDHHAARIAADGYTIINDFMDAGALAEARATLDMFSGRHRGRNDFEGFLTERVYTLVARGKVFERAAEDPRVMAIVGRFLQPGFLLTASQSICIHPGETAQNLHTDDGFYRIPRPRPAISFTLIAAIDAFTQANGATEILPRSHLWGDPEPGTWRTDPRLPQPQPVALEIPAGAAFIFPGTLIHRGGANRTDRSRLAFTNQYCEPWARPQENFFLSIPKAQVRQMSPQLQALLGYEVWPPFMGMVTGSHPAKALAEDFVPPVVAQRPSR